MESEWALIRGFHHLYRINRSGVVQQQKGDKWVTLKRSVTRRRVEVRFRDLDGKQKKYGVFRLLDKYFCGSYGETHGFRVCPANGVRTECTVDNIAYKTQSEIGRKSLTRTMKKPVVRYDRFGNTTLYESVQEAAKKNGLTPQALDRRIYHGILDPRGYKWEILKDA